MINTEIVLEIKVQYMENPQIAKIPVEGFFDAEGNPVTVFNHKKKFPIPTFTYGDITYSLGEINAQWALIAPKKYNTWSITKYGDLSYLSIQNDSYTRNQHEVFIGLIYGFIKNIFGVNIDEIPVDLLQE